MFMLICYMINFSLEYKYISNFDEIIKFEEIKQFKYKNYNIKVFKRIEMKCLFKNNKNITIKISFKCKSLIN